jgi:hypothetical protein
MTDLTTTGADTNRPRPAPVADYLSATCQYCLADCNHTPIGPDPDKRCPVCGSPYTGPSREREYLVLLAAGLVATGD